MTRWQYQFQKAKNKKQKTKSKRQKQITKFQKRHPERSRRANLKSLRTMLPSWEGLGVCSICLSQISNPCSYYSPLERGRGCVFIYLSQISNTCTNYSPLEIEDSTTPKQINKWSYRGWGCVLTNQKQQTLNKQKICNENCIYLKKQ